MYSCPIFILYHRWVRNFKFWVPKFILDLERDKIGSKIYFVKRMYQVGGVHDSCVPACRKTFPVKGKGKGKGKGKPAPVKSKGAAGYARGISAAEKSF